jgi:hypothetical protein
VTSYPTQSASTMAPTTPATLDRAATDEELAQSFRLIDARREHTWERFVRKSVRPNAPDK